MELEEVADTGSPVPEQRVGVRLLLLGLPMQSPSRRMPTLLTF